MIGFGKKVGMTRIFVDGVHVAVTAISFEEQKVLQKKTKEKEGYNSVQISSYPRKAKSKARTGHIKKYVKDFEGDFLTMGEFRDVEIDEGKTVININDFSQGDKLDIFGTSKGRGFAGAVKRWGFGGQPKSHGHDHVRAVGAIGGRWPQRVLPGTKMAGRMGGKSSAVKKAKVIDIDLDNNLIFVKGSVPGANGNFLKIKNLTKLKY